MPASMAWRMPAGFSGMPTSLCSSIESSPLRGGFPKCSARAKEHDLMDRRSLLWHAGGGLGGIALAYLLGRDHLLAADPFPQRGKPALNGGPRPPAPAQRRAQA